MMAPSRQGLDTHSAMLLPIFPLMFRGTVLDQSAFTTELADSPLSIVRRVLGWRWRVVAENDVAVDPVAHLLGDDSFSFSLGSHIQYGCALDPVTRESNELTIVCTARIRTACWIVAKDVFVRHVTWICEEYLGVGSRLVREQDEKTRFFFVEYCAERKIDLRETRRAALSDESVA